MRRGKAMHKRYRGQQYGGKTKALSAAKAWRDQVVKSTSDVDYVLWRREKRSRPSGGGIVGVGRYVVRYASVNGTRCGRHLTGCRHCGTAQPQIFHLGPWR